MCLLMDWFTVKFRLVLCHPTNLFPKTFPRFWFVFCILEEPYSYGSYDTGDPNTTNLYIGNISPEVCDIS